MTAEIPTLVFPRQDRGNSFGVKAHYNTFALNVETASKNELLTIPNAKQTDEGYVSAEVNNSAQGDQVPPSAASHPLQNVTAQKQQHPTPASKDPSLPTVPESSANYDPNSSQFELGNLFKMQQQRAQQMQKHNYMQALRLK